VEKSREIKPEYAVLLGDMNDGHEKIHSACLIEIEKFLNNLRQTVRNRVYLLIGNHDIPSNNLFLSTLHHFNSLGLIEGVVVVDKPFTAQIDNKIVGMVPYIPPGRFQEAVSLLKPDTLDALFCHQEFKNSMLGHLPSISGDDWPIANPLVISGHIHDHCQLQPNIVYVGIPRDTQFGSHAKRTISWFDSSDFKEIRIDLGFPKRLLMKITLEEAKTIDIPENSIVKLDISGEHSEILAFKKTKVFRDLANKAFIVFSPTDNESGSAITGRDRQMGYCELLVDYCSKEDIMVKETLEEVLRETHA
jgi:DNA repair exonuclease SbcCD nuclease subunit